MNNEQLPNTKERFHGFGALTKRDIKKWYGHWEVVVGTLLLPVVWMIIIGNGMNVHSLFVEIATKKFSLPIITAEIDSNELIMSLFGTKNYFTYISLGMVSFVILVSATIGAMSIASDRRMGFLTKALLSSVGRPTIVFSKVISTTFVSLIQAAIALIVAVLLGAIVSAPLEILNLLEVFAAFFLLAFGFSSFFLYVALRSTHWENQLVVMNTFNIPLVFANNAYYPITLMPAWLQSVVKLNPLSYAIDISRHLLVGTPAMATLPFDFIVLLIFAGSLFLLGFLLSLKFLTA